MFAIANWCSVVAQGTIQSWVLLGFPSLAIRPMANVGGVSEFLRWSHAEAFSKSVREFPLPWGWKRASVRLWCSIMRLLASNRVRGEF